MDNEGAVHIRNCARLSKASDAKDGVYIRLPPAVRFRSSSICILVGGEGTTVLPETSGLCFVSSDGPKLWGEAEGPGLVSRNGSEGARERLECVLNSGLTDF